MMFTRNAFAAAVAAALGAAGAQAQPSPRFTIETLPTLGGAAGSARALNDAGQVVGSARNSLGIERAYVWQRETGIVAIPGQALLRSMGLAINERGQVAGNYNEVSGDFYIGTPFLWTPGGGVSVLPLQDNRFRVYGVNDSGVVVGAGGVLGSSRQVPMLWSVGTGFVRLSPNLPSGSLAAINNAGQMGGQLMLGDSLTSIATFWDDPSSPRIVVADSLPGNSIASAINNGGQVAGYHNDTGAFTWSEAAGLRALERDGGTEGGSRPLGINDSGLVVGGRQNDVGTYTTATAWRPDGSLVDLAALTQVALTHAPDANNRAQIVVNSADRAHLLTLHPDWTGGDGNWSGGTGSRWNFAGLGAAGTVGAMHDVVINPGVSATVRGAQQGQARSLRVGGTAGQVVVLDLDGGTTAVGTRTTLDEGGVLRGTGRHQGDVSVGGQGRVEVGAGQTMQIAGDMAQQGVVDVRADSGQARLHVTGSWAARGQTHLLNGELRADGGMNNDGLLHVTGFSQVLGRVDNRASGRIQVSGAAGEAVFWDALVNNGSVNVTAGSTATFFGVVSGAGSFNGAGTKHFAGGYSPGNSPGQATLEGVVVFDGGTLLMELAGVTAGSQHDKLVFDNASVALRGGVVLNIALLEGYSPALGDAFDLFDWNGSLGEASGSFGDLLLPALADGLAWDVSRLYLSGDIGVTAVPEPQTWLLMALGLMGVALRRRGTTAAQRLPELLRIPH